MDDLISRQAAIDAMLGDKVQITNVIRAIGNERDFEVLNCTCDRHAEIIKALSAAPKDKSYELWKESFMEMKRRYDVLVERTKESVRQNQNADPGKMVGDCISRQAALDAIRAISDRGDSARANALGLAEHAVEALPPVQPAIIRCRDCKYSIDEYNDGDCYCKRPSRELVWIGKGWDFFCKAGAKREGEAYDQ